MTSLYLKCDGCGKTLGMEQVITTGNIHWGMKAEFLSRAVAEHGWKIVGAAHYCPCCGDSAAIAAQKGGA